MGSRDGWRCSAAAPAPAGSPPTSIRNSRSATRIFSRMIDDVRAGARGRRQEQVQHRTRRRRVVAVDHRSRGPPAPPRKTRSRSQSSVIRFVSAVIPPSVPPAARRRAPPGSSPRSRTSRSRSWPTPSAGAACESSEERQQGEHLRHRHRLAARPRRNGARAMGERSSPRRRPSPRCRAAGRRRSRTAASLPETATTPNADAMKSLSATGSITLPSAEAAEPPGERSVEQVGRRGDRQNHHAARRFETSGKRHRQRDAHHAHAGPPSSTCSRP